MGCLENGVPVNRESRFGRSSSIGGCEQSWGSSPVAVSGPKNRSRSVNRICARIRAVHLACLFIAVFVFLFLLQGYFLPVVGPEEPRKSSRVAHFFYKRGGGGNFPDFPFLDDLDFGDDADLELLNTLIKFQKEPRETNDSYNVRRYGYVKPKLALVFADLTVDPHHIHMFTVAKAIRDVGYEIEAFSLQDGTVSAVWKKFGYPVNVITADENMKFSIDWLNYNGILVSSLKAADALYSLMQEPFREIPLIWTIHEEVLARRLRDYASRGEVELIESWKRVFRRATAVVFPNQILPVAYSTCDPANFCVIPGFPMDDMEVNEHLADGKDNVKNEFVIVVVGSRLVYKAQWLEHALVLQALYPVFRGFISTNSHLKIIILIGASTPNYSSAFETIAKNLNYPNGTVEYVTDDAAGEDALQVADLVIYGSFREEPAFPVILQKAMLLGKPVVAPDMAMIRNYVSDWMNGFLFSKDKVSVLTDILFQLIDNGTLSVLAQSVALRGKATSRNFMVTECIEGYASLLENVLKLPSEVAASKPAKEIPKELKTEWGWRHFEDIHENSSTRYDTTDDFLNKFEKLLSSSSKDSSVNLSATDDNSFLYTIWEDQKLADMAFMRKKREDDELKDRTNQPQGTWDEIYRNVRRPDRVLHERDDGELERTAQPLCIYEPYYGQGTWPFLHNSSLYRGVGLLSRGRRPGADDVDAASRLQILSNAYFRDVLGEYGAYFAIANRIDRIHKNAWIGFQSWRATARKVSLSSAAERSLQDAIEGKRHGDALYFWVGMDTDPRSQPKQDFWSFCDAINAGNCQLAFGEALKKMYGLKSDLASLPPMPHDDGTWSVMHCWALPTRSFLEFAMFSRIFVDALDAQFSDEHRRTGWCHLNLSKDKHCYSRMLELLVNVWAYHSGRRMVYVQPETGSMQEQHQLRTRRGHMWIKWFQFSVLKSMDEELAEEFDSDRAAGWSLWSATGEVFWQGIYEKEKSQRIKEKERRKQQSRDKIHRMKNKSRQKVLGKYIKPADEENENITTTTTTTTAVTP